MIEHSVIQIGVYGGTASLVKGRGTALAVEGFITKQQESPRHFVALSITRLPAQTVLIRHPQDARTL